MARWVFMAILLARFTPARQEVEVRKRAEALLQKLDSDVPAERDAAAEALVEGGDDFERHLEKAAEEGKPEVRGRCQDILKRIELNRKRKDSWSPCKPITIALKDVPLKDAIDRLSKASGAEIKMGTANPKARVTLALDSVSFLAALEACCRSAGVWYKRTGPTLELAREKPPAASRCPVGPFTLSASAGKTKPGETVALQLDLEWDPGVRPRWYDVEIESGTDDRGGAISAAPVKEGRSFTELSITTRYLNMPKEGESKGWAFDVIELSPLSKGATRISSLKGKVRFHFPEEVQKVRFENPAKGDKKELGVITATLDDFGYAQLPKGWGASLELNTFRTQREKRPALFAMLLTSKMRFFDKGKKAYATTYSGSGFGGHVTDPLQRMSVHACSESFGEKDPPQAVEMNVVTDVWEKAYSFEFKEVPAAK